MDHVERLAHPGLHGFGDASCFIRNVCKQAIIASENSGVLCVCEEGGACTAGRPVLYHGQRELVELS